MRKRKGFWGFWSLRWEEEGSDFYDIVLEFLCEKRKGWIEGLKKWGILGLIERLNLDCKKRDWVKLFLEM